MMTETNLQLLQTPNIKKIYHQPWYKERLKTKYVKSQNPADTSNFLIGKNWKFVKNGLDDFRDGLPPILEDGCILKGNKGLGPTIKGESNSFVRIKQSTVPQRFSKYEICYSKATPLQQQRREHIDEIEYGLMQHPLALYPHLEECMPPDIFEDVVDILDPEMNMLSDDEESYSDEGTDVLRTPTPKQTVSKNKKYLKPDEELSEETKLRNPYRWILKTDDGEKKDKKKTADVRNVSPSQGKHITTVTKDFCQWVSNLGGETNNIEESTISSLFASGYETKPALSVPIHVVELTNVPPELRNSLSLADQTDQKNSSFDDPIQENLKSNKYIPSWINTTYGAWYLDPKTWKKRHKLAPLEDPQVIKDREMSESKKKGNALDTELAPMHGTKAFMDFIDKKSMRRPEFLDRVSEIQKVQVEEENAKVEMELAKQMKIKKKQ